MQNALNANAVWADCEENDVRAEDGAREAGAYLLAGLMAERVL